MRSLTYCFTVIVALLVSASAMADDIPYRQQRREIFTLLPVNSNSIVFLGDSITDIGLWSEFFGSDPDIINRGIQGIESPETELYVQSILPCNISTRANVPVIFNPQIQRTCEELDATYIDIFGELTTLSGGTSMPSYMTDDGLHPNALGYCEWCRLIAPYVGKDSSISETLVPIKPLRRAIFNSILTEFQMLPINDGDILHIGDYQVMTGEWSELMGTPIFKNRGLGGGFGWSLSLQEFNDSYSCFIKGKPSKIFFHCGKRALDARETPADSLFMDYQAAVMNIRSAAPDAEIYLESMVPNADASINTEYIVPFNTLISDYVAEDKSGKLHYVDIYDALEEDGVLSPSYQGANTEQSRGINGYGYIVWANVLKQFIE